MDVAAAFVSALRIWLLSFFAWLDCGRQWSLPFLTREEPRELITPTDVAKATVGVFYAQLFLGYGRRRAWDGRAFLAFRCRRATRRRILSARDAHRQCHRLIRHRNFCGRGR